jgi:hypothetical protein
LIGNFGGLAHGDGIGYHARVEPENNTRAGSRHRMGWLVILLLLPVMYVLLMAPINAWAIKEQISNELPLPVWVVRLNVPLDWTLAHSRQAHDGWALYQS